MIPCFKNASATGALCASAVIAAVTLTGPSVAQAAPAPKISPATVQKADARNPGFRQQAERRRIRPIRRVWRRTKPRVWRHNPGHTRPLVGIRVCSPGFYVVARGLNTPGSTYYCYSNVSMVCATPYAYDFHGVGNIGGGEGENFPYYRCKRQQMSNHIGAVKCATGFSQSPSNAHPTTHSQYLCRMTGLEPKCGHGRHYSNVKKTASGWTYRCS